MVKFNGAIGVDIKLRNLLKIVEHINIIENNWQAILVSDNKESIDKYNKNNNLITEDLDTFIENNEKKMVLEKKDSIVFYNRLSIGSTLIVKTPKSKINLKSNKIISEFIILLVVILLSVIFIIYIVVKKPNKQYY